MDDAFILGYGFIGKATAKALEIPHFFSHKESNITLEEAAKKLYCLICLPTPTDEHGQQQGVTTIMDYIKQIQQYGGRNIFVVRSTVLPGTCRNLAKETGAMVVSNPEFLSEATAEFDALHPRLKVIGADDIPSLKAVEKLWEPIKTKLDIKTDTVTAEMIKYTMNVFAAVKVVFANQLYDQCEKIDADYEVIHKVLHEHPWGSKHHFKVIHNGGRGAGGHCIPKDLKAFATYTNSKFLKMTEEVNTELLRKTGKK